MKEITIISGKGGTGKTSITASLAYLAKNESIIGDCDVDASDMHLLLKPDFAHTETFFSGKIAYINEELCTNCGRCKDVCRFDSIPIIDNQHVISEIDCEGCGYCAKVCPTEAIEMKDNETGELYISKTRLGNTLVHAALNIGSENSGKLVSKVRKEAKQIAEEKNIPYIIIDGTPGIGCPVIASITGTDYVVIVTEPTISGIHDLTRVLELTSKFKIPTGCIINKSDLNTEVTNKLKKFLENESIDLLATLPYHHLFNEAVTLGKTVVEHDSNQIVSSELIGCWEVIKEKLNN